MLLFVVTLFLQLCIVVKATLEVYEGPEPTSNTSPFFTVQLQQNQITAFPHVYFSKVNNAFVANSHFYNQTISWIEFGQESNDEITVIICLNAEKKGKFINYSNSNPPYILPHQYNIDPKTHMKLVNDTCISVYLDSSIGNEKHMSLEYKSTKTNSFHDAFYIFIGDLDPIYNKSDPHTLHFSAGEHNIVSNSNKKNSILQTGDNIHTLYISRGAWVYGKLDISGTNNSQTVHIIGHGILDGSYFNWADRKTNKADGASMIGFSNDNKPVRLIGLTIHNPSDSAISWLTPHSYVKQYRCIGWYFNNDGIGLSSNSYLSNSFIRTNDDSVKPWTGGPQHIENIVISQMYNGASFQLGWNSVGCVNCVILNSSIIHAYWYDDWAQNSVIDLNYNWPTGQKKKAEWRNVLFENIYIDTPVGRMFSIKLNNSVDGASTTINNLTVRNFISRTPLHWFDDNNTIFQMIQMENNNHGTNSVHGVHFDNLKIGGKHIVNDKDPEWNMCYFGDTAGVQKATYS